MGVRGKGPEEMTGEELPQELAKLWEGKPGILNRKSYMSLAYLAQELAGIPLGYRFTLYSYGPDCREVLADLEYARAMGKVREDPGREITPAEIRTETDRNGAGQLGALAERFGECSPRELGTRAALVFLWTGDAEETVRALRNLKPHVTEEKARQALADLTEMMRGR